jgi:hypothetical protein
MLVSQPVVINTLTVSQVQLLSAEVAQLPTKPILSLALECVFDADYRVKVKYRVLLLDPPSDPVLPHSPTSFIPSSTPFVPL